jgi:hypothetical protein
MLGFPTYVAAELAMRETTDVGQILFAEFACWQGGRPWTTTIAPYLLMEKQLSDQTSV